MLKLKEEFDYKSLSRRLDIQLDKLIAENERQKKVFDDEIERINLEAEKRIAEAERNYADALEVSFWTICCHEIYFIFVCVHSRGSICENPRKISK